MDYLMDVEFNLRPHPLWELSHCSSHGTKELGNIVFILGKSSTSWRWLVVEVLYELLLNSICTLLQLLTWVGVLSMKHLMLIAQEADKDFELNSHLHYRPRIIFYANSAPIIFVIRQVGMLPMAASRLSINQSNFYSANIPGVAMLSGAGFAAHVPLLVLERW